MLGNSPSEEERQTEYVSVASTSTKLNWASLCGPGDEVIVSFYGQGGKTDFPRRTGVRKGENLKMIQDSAGRSPLTG